MTDSTNPHDAAGPSATPHPEQTAAADQANDAAGTPDPIAAAQALAERLAAAEAEIAELKDRALRAAAEVENTRRRLERDKEEAVKNAAGRFARDILPVADNLSRALTSVPADAELPEPVKNLLAGVEMTERELLNVFERHGIKRIDPRGARFDPNLHNAMFEVEDPTQPAGTVVHMVSFGYTIAGRLLRAAEVGVSKGGPRAEAAGIDTQA